MTAIYGTRTGRRPSTGTDNAYFITQDWKLSPRPQLPTPARRGGAAVCIIGETVREELFGAADPLGSHHPPRHVSCR